MWNLSAVQQEIVILKEIIEDMDNILNTNQYFMLGLPLFYFFVFYLGFVMVVFAGIHIKKIHGAKKGKWIELSHSHTNASDINGTQWWEFNARNQITLWGPNGEISDYGFFYFLFFSQLFSFFFDIFSKKTNKR